MLKEEKMVAQIAAEQIRPGQLHRWKRQALDNFPHLFTESQALKQQADAHEQQLAELYAEIGKLTTQLEWLKKIWPRPSRALSGACSSTWGRIPCRSRLKRPC
jgi:putative transposase